MSDPREQLDQIFDELTSSAAWHIAAAVDVLRRRCEDPSWVERQFGKDKRKALKARNVSAGIHCAILFRDAVSDLIASLNPDRMTEALVYMHRATKLHDQVLASHRETEALRARGSRAGLAARRGIESRNAWLREMWQGLAPRFPDRSRRAAAIRKRWPEEEGWKRLSEKRIKELARERDW